MEALGLQDKIKLNIGKQAVQDQILSSTIIKTNLYLGYCSLTSTILLGKGMEIICLIYTSLLFYFIIVKKAHKVCVCGSSSSGQSCGRSEERRVGKECRSRWSP